ncbi:hypothetical protein JUN65_02120 [Gluconacetobacter azotocaptans]|uniref:hypothetical protein n=1 Tax=Gluconacetobacter azotocaptans TaxID=142834 RepID=UPI00195E3EBF|nr:hypothetical protein [Gluconacetobacter azotocaptans]MBM9400390.1 hypothetical protein [Gluconacetobacter azotocaptans]
MSGSITFPGALPLVEAAAGVEALADNGQGPCRVDLGGLLPAPVKDLVPEPWQPTLLFGGANVGQILGDGPAYYVLDRGFCELWCSIRLIYKGSSTGQATIGNLPAPAMGGFEFPAIVGGAMGIAAGGAIAAATVLNGGVMLYRGQATGDPLSVASDLDFENAAVLNLYVRYPVEIS